MAKEYFKSKGVEFTEKDVSTDIEAQKEMIDLSGQMGVPVLNMDGTVVVGFNRPKIDAVLSQNR